MTDFDLSRRDLLRRGALLASALTLPPSFRWVDPDHERLRAWTETLRNEGLAKESIGLGKSVVRVGELAAGTPYEPGTLEAYIKAGGSPLAEPLIVSLTQFDCVTLVESCLAVSRTARAGAATWDRFRAEMERMRYREGRRIGYASRLHYFSEWIRDGASRHLVRDLGQSLGGVNDERPLRFMTEHRSSYPALVDDDVFGEIGGMERRLDGAERWIVRPDQLAKVTGQIQTGDVLAFGTSIQGLDVTHSAMAYRDREGRLRVLHAPLSGGVVEVTRSTLIEYVAAIRRCTGVMVVRPLGG